MNILPWWLSYPRGRGGSLHGLTWKFGPHRAFQLIPWHGRTQNAQSADVKCKGLLLFCNPSGTLTASIPALTPFTPRGRAFIHSGKRAPAVLVPVLSRLPRGGGLATNRGGLDTWLSWSQQDVSQLLEQLIQQLLIC